MSVTLDQLKNPETEIWQRSLSSACRIRSFSVQDLATVDTIFLSKLPAVGDRASRLAVKRQTDVGIEVLTPVAEQLAQPLPRAMALATLDEIASGAYKELPAGTRLVVTLCVDEPEEKLQMLKDLDLIMIL